MPNNLLELEELKGLSEEERKYALEILKEFSSGGKSEKLNNLILSDYKEPPVDIITFIKDRRYLGNAWYSPDGKCKLYEYWEEKLKQLFPDPYTTNYNNFIESGARGLGKAQPLYSKVLTDKGFVNMGDIKVGDMVFGDDGKTHKVIGVFPQGKKKVYEVVFSDRSRTQCCDEHLWNIRKMNSHNKKYRTVELKQIMSNEIFGIGKNGLKYSLYSIPMCSPIDFEHKDLFIDPYVMGCLLGDGSLSRKSIDFTSKDYSIIESLNSIVEKNGYVFNPVVGSYSYGLKRIKHKNSPNEYLEELIRYGLNCKSEHKKIPDDYKFNDVKTRLSVLQGLMDTDGYCDKKGYTSFTTVSKNLADDVVFIVQSLGGNAPVRVRTNRGYTNKYGEKIVCKTAYEVTVKLPKDLIPFRLDRKINRLKETRKCPVRCIKEINYIGEEECKCILLDSDSHLYITDDFIVTHNSEIAVTVGLYMMHRIMCLKNPHLYLNLKPTEKVAFAFMNITIKLAEEIGISKFQATVKESPWFMKRGTITKRDNDTYWNPPNYINIIIGSQSSHVIGQPIYFAFFDEISFIKNQDIDKQKKIALDMIDTAIGGMKTRFLHNGKNPTLMVLASSKRSEKSFLEEHMKKKIADEDSSVLIVDEPVWNVKPKGTYKGNTFKVAKGNRFLPSEIIPDGEDEDIYISKGYSILNVPEEFKSEFKDDIDRALCDFAGVSSSDIMKYISGAKFIENADMSLKNPFTKEVLEVGNEDNLQYFDFFDMSRVPKELMYKPLYVHLDMSVSGDNTGIAGTWIVGKRHSSGNVSSQNEVHFQLAFSVSIKAPKGRQISFEKNRLFIYWLKEQGFNVRGVSSDTYQNVSLSQDLISKGFKYDVISVDRVNSEKVCEPYAYFKTVIYENRIKVFSCKLLQEEIVGLERNTNSGKIDHPDGGRYGSKDMADAVCASVFNASKHADEFSFEYGETLDVMHEVSTTHNYETDRKQVSVDFEQELNKLLDPMNTPEQRRKYKSPTEEMMSYSLLNDGILLI